MKVYGKSLPLPSSLEGVCDFAVDVERSGDIRILQITDTQIIDASQRRVPERLRQDEIDTWKPENTDVLCYHQIRSLVAQARPDLILITGDIVYGEFDDSGRIWIEFSDFMESLDIPWAPVFGNHDNEASVGVDWQCERLSEREHCLFARGSVSGNGNYTVALLQNGTPVRLIHMLDSHGCLCRPAICEDQASMLGERFEAASKAGLDLPCFLAHHIPTKGFFDAASEKGYSEPHYTIGVDYSAKDGDFGCHFERGRPAPAPEDFFDLMKKIGVDGVFTGHSHAINTSILWQGIRFTYGMKTGQYDYYLPGQIGGTMITLRGSEFTVNHLPILMPLGPMVAKSRFW